MTRVDELREHAERCRRLASSVTDQNKVRILLGLADDYLTRAERLEGLWATLPPTPSSTAAERPMQQQQQVQPKQER